MKQMQRWKLLAGCVALVVGIPGSTRAQGRHGAPREGVRRPAPETAHGLDAEEAVDLDSLEAEERGERDGRTEALGGFGGRHGHGHGHGSAFPAKVKLFFDLIAEHELDSDAWQFTRDHAHVILELLPSETLHFRTDVAYEPAFFELGWRLTPTLELRLGKVLVPFGQNEFHHLIGGRVDERSLFLPVIWADYGVALRHRVVDSDWGTLDYTACVVNGFEGAGGVLSAHGDPSDNNMAKGVGLRPTLSLGTALTLGTSWYVDAWDEDSAEAILYYGFDLELGYGLLDLPVLRAMRLRAEIAWGEVQLSDADNRYRGLIAYGMRKSGYNVELSYRVLDWLVLRYREGRLNADSRVLDDEDLRVHEPAVIAIFGPVHVSLVLELHTQLTDSIDPPPGEGSKVYTRVFIRY